VGIECCEKALGIVEGVLASDPIPAANLFVDTSNAPQTATKCHLSPVQLPNVVEVPAEGCSGGWHSLNNKVERRVDKPYGGWCEHTLFVKLSCRSGAQRVKNEEKENEPKNAPAPASLRLVFFALR
jgi:hypothetical protein